MSSNGSFYQNGLPLSTLETGLGNVSPGLPVANKNNSSFYLNGSVYQTLANQDALLALITADTSLVVADLVASNVAAANAAASATSAATSLATLLTTALLRANNLSDLASVTTAKTNLALDQVNNTSDANKPLSTADITALALKAPLASPALTGVPTAPTATALTSTTQLATTAYADAAVSTLSGTVTTALALKSPLASPTFTGAVKFSQSGGHSIGAASPGLGWGVYNAGVITATSGFAIGWQTDASLTAAVNGDSLQGVRITSTPVKGAFTGVVSTGLYIAGGSAPFDFGIKVSDTSPVSFGGTLAVTGASTFSSSVTYGGVTLANAVTGTGSMVLSASPALTGTPTAPTATAGTNTTQLATTAFVLGQLATVAPLIDGTAAVGTSLLTARQDHVHPTDTTRAALASPTFTGVPAAPTATVGTNTTQLATTAFVIANAASAGVTSIAGNTGAFTLAGGLTNSTNVLKIDPAVLRGYLTGLTLSTAGSSSTYGIAIGVAMDGAATDFMKLTSAYTKTTAAWALGTGVGSLDTGTIAASIWYHVYLIKRTDTGVVDVLCSQSATAPTLPGVYTLFRRIGSMKTNGSSQWTKFVQLGDTFLLDVDVTDINAVATSVSRTLVTLSAVPSGVQVDALIRCFVVSATIGSALLITSPDVSDQVSTGPFDCIVSTANQYAGCNIQRRTNTSAQLGVRASGASITSLGYTYGWIDTRGKLS